MAVLVSIIIRTYNEQRFLRECLLSIQRQNLVEKVEIIIVDSGSQDNTVKIASQFPTKILNINKKEFTFGRALNLGFSAASGDILVNISAHCVPTNKKWLSELIGPIIKGECDITFGRQIARDTENKSSEKLIFSKFFPELDQVKKVKNFCHNANSAISRNVLEKIKFDEELCALEDIDLAVKADKSGFEICYVPLSIVEHIHTESYKKIRFRYTNEAIAFGLIHKCRSISFHQALQMFCSSIKLDMRQTSKLTITRLWEIILFRFNQYVGYWQANKKLEGYNQLEDSSYYDPLTKNYIYELE